LMTNVTSYRLDRSVSTSWSGVVFRSLPWRSTGRPSSRMLLSRSRDGLGWDPRTVFPYFSRRPSRWPAPPGSCRPTGPRGDVGGGGGGGLRGVPEGGRTRARGARDASPPLPELGGVLADDVAGGGRGRDALAAADPLLDHQLGFLVGELVPGLLHELAEGV